MKPEIYLHNGREVVFVESINPWEFRGYYQGEDSGVRFQFRYSECENREKREAK